MSERAPTPEDFKQASAETIKSFHLLITKIAEQGKKSKDLPGYTLFTKEYRLEGKRFEFLSRKIRADQTIIDDRAITQLMVLSEITPSLRKIDIYRLDVSNHLEHQVIPVDMKKIREHGEDAEALKEEVSKIILQGERNREAEREFGANLVSEQEIEEMSDLINRVTVEGEQVE